MARGRAQCGGYFRRLPRRQRNLLSGSDAGPRLHLNKKTLARAVKRISCWIAAATKPGPMTTACASVLDFARSRRSLMAENAQLRHQLVVLSRAAGRPRFTSWDRGELLKLGIRICKCERPSKYAGWQS